MADIKKIVGFHNFGKFSQFTQNVEFNYGEQDNVNIIFGFNGSGKTTISNALSLFGDNAFISEEEKEKIFNDIKLNDQSYVELCIENTNVKYPSNRPKNQKIYCFNPNFVSAHIFDGSRGKAKKFTKNKAEFTTPEIERINNAITLLTYEQKERDDLKTAYDASFERIEEYYRKEFNNHISGKRLTSLPDISTASLPTQTFAEIENGLTKLLEDYQLGQKQTEITADIKTLRSLFIEGITIDFTAIEGILNKEVAQLSKEALERKILATQALYDNDEYKGSVQRWYRFGKDILEKGKDSGHDICPLCGSDISSSLDELLSDFQGYFDKSYEDFITSANEIIDALKTSLITVANQKSAIQAFEKIRAKYVSLLPIPTPDAIIQIKIEERINDIVKAVESKCRNIQSKQELSQQTKDDVSNYSSCIGEASKLLSSAIETLDAKAVNPDKIVDSIKRAYLNLMILKFDLGDKSKGGNLKAYQDIIRRSTEIASNNTTGLPYWKAQLNEEIKKLKVESKSIAKYLQKLGVGHFIVDISDSEEENVIIKYRDSAVEKSRIRNCLSEGEKTALAFAYFLSKFENEVNADEDIKASVVVIDDPISSLDENRLYSTATLIKEVFYNARQLVVLSHNFLFLKFFYSCCNKAACLFLSDCTLTELPEELKNFETPYYYMLRKIEQYVAEENRDYIQAKLYLPNMIRRVLETFLSFKFSRIVGRGKRSPGLNEFGDNIDQTSYDELTKSELKAIINDIVKITDAHSHGNAQHQQESCYISETDLLKLAQNAMNVIDRMDNLHLSSFQINNKDKVERKKGPKIQAISFSQNDN